MDLPVIPNFIYRLYEECKEAAFIVLTSLLYCMLLAIYKRI